MDVILDMLSRGVEQLLGRASGPLHFRLLIMPTLVTILAIRAGLRDAREGEPTFLWGILKNPAERPRLVHSGVKDIGRIFIVAIVLDTIYQIIVFKFFYVVQTLIVAVACAIVPYILMRGPITLLTRRLYKSQAGSANRTTKEEAGKE